MRTAVQTQPGQAASAALSAPALEQERFPADFSDEAFWIDRQRNIAEFNKLCEEASKEARANGLTEEILAEILAER
jgi:hypothetical protein